MLYLFQVHTLPSNISKKNTVNLLKKNRERNLSLLNSLYRREILPGSAACKFQTLQDIEGFGIAPESNNCLNNPWSILDYPVLTSPSVDNTTIVSDVLQKVTLQDWRELSGISILPFSGKF
jgi:hypothetical protein